jgi:hypothetical protein
LNWRWDEHPNTKHLTTNDFGYDSDYSATCFLVVGGIGYFYDKEESDFEEKVNREIVKMRQRSIEGDY